MAGDETLGEIGDLALTMLHETKWDKFIRLEDDDAAGEGGLRKLMKKQVKRMESAKQMKTMESLSASDSQKEIKPVTGVSFQLKRPNLESSSLEGDEKCISTLTSIDDNKELNQKQPSLILSTSGTTVRLLRTKTFAGHAKKSHESLAETETRNFLAEEEREQKIDELLEKGHNLMRLEVFAIPKMYWSTDKTAHPDELRALDRAGFLIESYHAYAWWWEIYEVCCVCMHLAY
jgi:hypothetical protein